MPVIFDKKVSLKKNGIVQERFEYEKRMYDKYPYVTGDGPDNMKDFFQEGLRNNDLRVLKGFFSSNLTVR